MVVPAPPSKIRSFFEDNDIIQEDRLQTIGALLEWCRDNLCHFEGEVSAGNCQLHWGYRGVPPVSRIIDGVPYVVYNGTRIFDGSALFDDITAGGNIHYTMGCGGTVAFLKAVLRVANIPVYFVQADGHSTAYFPSEGKYLSHGDDPYSDIYVSTPQYPAIELLINQTTYDSWFGANVSENTKERNVGRQVTELAIQHLPNILLRWYCLDSEAGLSHSEGRVYQLSDLQRVYTVAELEDMNFWNRLAAKIEQLGGRDYVMNLRLSRYPLD